MSVIVLHKGAIFGTDPPKVTLWPEFKPNHASRHEYLSGIELSENGLSSATVGALISYRTFILPPTYLRAGVDIPDITGFQVCLNTTDEFDGVNVSLEVEEFGGWVMLAQGSVRTAAVGDEREWIDVYFDEPIRVPTERVSRRFRIGVQSASPIWHGVDGVAFKLFAFTADSGDDFLSNHYRSMVKRSAVSNFDTVATDRANSFWYSKPNPSKYSVESLYFDVRDTNHKGTVVDRLLVDPITPGVYFNLYYSNEGEPGRSEREWEEKLWTPVFNIFKMERRQEHPLPEPVTAKYMKVEFTHLQAQHYSPGTFAQPIRYKKHPKWVLDYFMARLSSQQNTEDPFVARRVRVVYNALELGYDYYLDDLQQKPADPLTPNDVTAFMTDRSDMSDMIDQDTLQRVTSEMRPFTREPAARANGLGYLLSAYNDPQGNNYPVEQITPLRADTTQVSQLDREALVVEQNYPVMFFYVPSRHTYREVEAAFENDRAYFVGVREFAFTRDHYTVAADQELYVENLSDFTNVTRNDFIEEDYVPFIRNTGTEPPPPVGEPGVIITKNTITVT